MRRSAEIGLVEFRLSRPPKGIESDVDRSNTYDFLLVIYSNDGPISYWLI